MQHYILQRVSVYLLSVYERFGSEHPPPVPTVAAAAAAAATLIRCGTGVKTPQALRSTQHNSRAQARARAWMFARIIRIILQFALCSSRTARIGSSAKRT